MIASIDRFGRVIIPKKIRSLIGLTRGSTVNIEVDGQRIVIQHAEESAVTEKDGFFVYSGKLSEEAENLLSEDRESRARKLLGF